jgi:hypothetical protein
VRYLLIGSWILLLVADMFIFLTEDYLAGGLFLILIIVVGILAFKEEG